ncbi:hypothetical protein Ae201684P_015496 [Aphanomyces euteiches]|nr:hypothetical protein Ae201684P_015496 [Aphanomyces euteiches]
MDEEETTQMQDQEEGQVVYKNMTFKDRKSCTTFLQDFVLSQGKRLVVDKKASGGKSVIFRCSSPTPCSFEVRVLKSKKKNVHGYFVSSCVLEHHGCTGHARPTCRQISELEVTQAAVTANPKASARSLIGQVRQTNAIECSQRMMYRVQTKITEENLGDYENNFKKVESLLEEFERANPGSRQVFERDHEGRYKRAFLSNPFVARHVKHVQKVLGIQLVSLDGFEFSLFSCDPQSSTFLMAEEHQGLEYFRPEQAQDQSHARRNSRQENS